MLPKLRPQTVLILRRVFAIALSLFAVALAIRFIPILFDTLNTHPYDGKVDWLAARAWVSHENPYSPELLARNKLDGLGHPPTTSFWFLPLAHLDLQMMSRVLGHLSVFLLVFTLFLTLDELGLPLALPLACVLALTILFTHWMRFHLHLAQISQLISFLFLLAWLALRRDEEILGGVFLGAICTLKLFPGMLAVFLLFQRRLRAVVTAGVVYLVVAAIMTSRFGLVAWPQFMKSEKVIVDFWIGNMRNASLHGIVLRAFHPVCVQQAGAKWYATALASAIALGLFALCVYLYHRLPAERKRDTLFRTDIPCSLLLMLGVFCNPFVYEHYQALTVVPLCVALYAIVRCYRSGILSLRLGLFALGLIGFLLVPMFYEPWRFLGVMAFRQSPHHYGVHALELWNASIFPALVAVFVLILIAAGRRPATEPSSDPAASAVPVA